MDFNIWDIPHYLYDYAGAGVGKMKSLMRILLGGYDGRHCYL